MRNQIPWTIRFDDEELLDDIRVIAEEEHRSLNSMVNQLLREAVKEWKKRNNE